MDIRQLFTDIGTIAGVLGVIVGALGVFTSFQTNFQERRRRRRQETLPGSTIVPEELPPPRVRTEPSADDADAESVGRLRLAVRAELRDERRSAFWPSFWTNLGTNFIVGIIFYALGIVTTLILSQPH